MPLESGHGVLLVVFAVVLVAPRLARLVQLPELVGLLIGGVAVGPHGLGIIERTGTVEVLGTAGLLYLMFQAGLELDHDEAFAQRKSAAVFGTLTFALPFAIGTAAHFLLGFPALAALLLGSCWASHTLLTYPMFQQARAVSNRAVAIGVAGTVLTDTVALLVLVILAKAHQGELTAGGLALQLPLMAAAGGVILLGLPRLTGWFFAGIGRERSARFSFVVVALFASALLAEAVGVEPIIGAFFAGLSLNRHVVEGSELDTTIRQFGSTMFVPIFLISVGMLVDPTSVFTDRRTLLLAVTFTAVVIVAKSLAAAVTARIYRLDSAERTALIALSVPQAAATLAAVFVGFEIGLLELGTVDAVVIVILLTCLFGTAAAKRAIERLPAPPHRPKPLGKRIIVPIAPSRSNVSVIEVAAALGKRDSGTVYPVSVLDLGSTNASVAELRRRMVAVEEQAALSAGCEAQSIVRLDLTPAAGLVHVTVETDATLVVLPWDGRHSGSHDRFSSTADTLLDLAQTPIVIANAGELSAYRRLVLRLDRGDLIASHSSEPQGDAAALAWLVATRLALHLKIPLLLCTDADEATLDGVPGITAHVSEVNQLADAADHRPDPSDLTVRLLGGVAEHQSTIWVALPRLSARPEPLTEPGSEAGSDRAGKACGGS